MGRRISALVLAAFAAGCGQHTQPHSSADEIERVPTHVTESEEYVDEESTGSSGGFHFYDSERKPPAIAEVYSVFSRPQTPAEAQLARKLKRENHFTPVPDDLIRPPDMTEDEWRATRLGAVLYEQGRILLEGLGGDEDTLFAAPTANGHLCYALLPNGGGGCGGVGPDGFDLAYNYDPPKLVVYGFIADNVRSVEIAIAGETHPARIGTNAYGVRVDPARPSEIDAALLHLTDGTTTRIPLRAQWP